MRFDDKKFVADRIKYYRKKKNFSQRELAEKVGLGEQAISRLECGYYLPSLKTFFMIVSVLNIDLSEFGYSNNEVKNPVKRLLIDRINSASEEELIFYKNLFESIDKSFVEFRENYHIFRNF